MKIEIEMEKTGMGEDDGIEKYMEMERKEHPWMPDDMLHKIVMDHLSKDKNFYEHEEEESKADEDNEELMGRKEEEGAEDPFKEY